MERKVVCIFPCLRERKRAISLIWRLRVLGWVIPLKAQYLLILDEQDCFPRQTWVPWFVGIKRKSSPWFTQWYKLLNNLPPTGQIAQSISPLLLERNKPKWQECIVLPPSIIWVGVEGCLQVPPCNLRLNCENLYLLYKCYHAGQINKRIPCSVLIVYYFIE